MAAPVLPFIASVLVLAAAGLLQYVNRPLGIVAIAVAYLLEAILIPDTLYAFLEDMTLFSFIAFLYTNLWSAKAAIAIKLQPKDFLILPFVMTAFNVIILLRVIDPSLGCSSFAAYGASIS